MRLLEDGAVAALAAIGLATLLFLLTSAVVHPRRRGTLEAVAVVPVRGGAEKLEHTVRALERSRYEEGGFARIVILDCGADEETKTIAALLCRDDLGVTLCTPQTLARELERGGTA